MWTCIVHPYYSSPNRYPNPTHSTTVSFLILEFYCNFSFFTFILVLRSVCGGESGVTEIWDDLDLHLGAKVHLANMHKSQKQGHQLEKNTSTESLGKDIGNQLTSYHCQFLLLCPSVTKIRMAISRKQRSVGGKTTRFLVPFQKFLLAISLKRKELVSK